MQAQVIPFSYVGVNRDKARYHLSQPHSKGE